MAKVYALNALLLSASSGEPTNHLRRARNKASSLKMTKRCLPAFFVQDQEVVDYTTQAKHRASGRAAYRSSSRSARAPSTAPPSPGRRGLRSPSRR